MIVYRLGNTKYSSDTTGEGARLFGGRWNNILTACIYTSESRALALLEYTVNVNIDNIPGKLSITAFEIPDIGIREFKINELPGNWAQIPSPASTKDFGTNLLHDPSVPVLKRPSIIIPEEFNYILNPLYHDRSIFKIHSVTEFICDVRIKG